MEEDNKGLTGQTQTGTDSKETKRAATKKSTAKTTSKAKTTETSPAPSIDTNPMPTTGAPQAGDPADMSSASEASAIPVGGDPSGSTPSPEYRGNTAEDIAGQTPAAAPTGAAAKVLDAALAGAYLETEGSESMPTDKTTAASKSKGDPFAALAKEYAKLYPKNKTFHITSDKQVFLEKNKSMADLHQRNQKGGKVTSITID